jgi:hypothetical protein
MGNEARQVWRFPNAPWKSVRYIYSNYRQEWNSQLQCSIIFGKRVTDGQYALWFDVILAQYSAKFGQLGLWRACDGFETAFDAAINQRPVELIFGCSGNDVLSDTPLEGRYCIERPFDKSC